MRAAEKEALKRAWNHLDDAIQALYEARLDNLVGIIVHKDRMDDALNALSTLAAAEGVKLV
jgi:hypothetical protein